MRRCGLPKAVWGVLWALLAVNLAWVAFAATLPDTVTDGKTVKSRRGSLGADSYVVTEVSPDPPAYQIASVKDDKLRDRCVNYTAMDGTSAVFALPGKRTTAGYARAFILYLDVQADGGCNVSFTGADALFTTDWLDNPKVGKGKRIFSFIEIGNNEYLVETRELEEIKED